MFVSGGFDSYLLRLHPQCSSYVILHFGNEREQLWLLGNNRGIQVNNLSFSLGNLPGCFLQKDAARDTPPSRVSVWKEMADVALAQCAEHGVADRVHEHISV